MGIEFLLAIVSGMLISNVVLTRFLGICPFLGVSKKLSSAIGMGATVLFILVLANLIIWPINRFILRPADLLFLDIIVLILVTASLVQLTEIATKKFSPSLYKSLGVYLPLIATNCAIIGTTSSSLSTNLSFINTMSTAIGTGLGFMLIIIIFSAIRERLELANVPKAFKGAPIALVVTAIMALAFMGFAGMI